MKIVKMVKGREKIVFGKEFVPQTNIPAMRREGSAIYVVNEHGESYAVFRDAKKMMELVDRLKKEEYKVADLNKISDVDFDKYDFTYGRFEGKLRYLPRKGFYHFYGSDGEIWDVQFEGDRDFPAVICQCEQAT